MWRTWAEWTHVNSSENGRKQKAMRMDTHMCNCAKLTLCMLFICRLPEAVDDAPLHPLHEGYDAAYATTGNCQQLYPTCKESVWHPKDMSQ